jgi:hypothetical protein
VFIEALNPNFVRTYFGHDGSGAGYISAESPSGFILMRDRARRCDHWPDTPPANYLHVIATLMSDLCAENDCSRLAKCLNYPIAGMAIAVASPDGDHGMGTPAYFGIQPPEILTHSCFVIFVCLASILLGPDHTPVV